MLCYAKKLKGPVVLDGEIVALDEKGEPAGFQRLQNRIHLTESNSRFAAGRVAFIAFDILRDGSEDLRPLPLTDRRARLERVFRNPGSPILRTSEVVAGDARELYQHALDHGWEGLIAKDARSPYHTGKRTRDWRKLKIVQEQEFVVGGWTDSRTTGRPFGALLLGYYEDGGLKYAGHTGQRIQPPRARARHPFAEADRDHVIAIHHPAANQPAAALDEAVVRGASEIHGVDRRRPAPPSDLSRHEGRCETGDGTTGAEESGESEESESESPESPKSLKSPADTFQAVLDQLDEIDRGPGSGTLAVARGADAGGHAICARCSGRS